ncbi:MAG: hypothetical protein MHM6MM_007308 [Cercozoa sp. M6MM]
MSSSSESSSSGGGSLSHSAEVVDDRALLDADMSEAVARVVLAVSEPEQVNVGEGVDFSSVRGQHASSSSHTSHHRRDGLKGDHSSDNSSSSESGGENDGYNENYVDSDIVRRKLVTGHEESQRLVPVRVMERFVEESHMKLGDGYELRGPMEALDSSRSTRSTLFSPLSLDIEPLLKGSKLNGPSSRSRKKAKGEKTDCFTEILEKHRQGFVTELHEKDEKLRQLAQIISEKVSVHEQAVAAFAAERRKLTTDLCNRELSLRTALLDTQNLLGEAQANITLSSVDESPDTSKEAVRAEPSEVGEIPQVLKQFDDELVKFRDLGTVLKEEEKDARCTAREMLAQSLTEDTQQAAELRRALENQLASLVEQLESMKATLQHNGERLFYNLAVLGERVRENMDTIDFHRSALFKKKDAAAEAQDKYQRERATMLRENSKLKDDYSRLQSQFSALQRRFRSRQRYNEDRYADIWRMKHAEALHVLARLLKAGRAINEMVLGTGWSSPLSTKQLQVISSIRVSNRFGREHRKAYQEAVKAQKERKLPGQSPASEKVAAKLSKTARSSTSSLHSTGTGTRSVALFFSLVGGGTSGSLPGGFGSIEAGSSSIISGATGLSGLSASTVGGMMAQSAYPPEAVTRLVELLVAEADWLIDDRLQEQLRSGDIPAELQKMYRLDAVMSALRIEEWDDLEELCVMYYGEKPQTEMQAVQDEELGAIDIDEQLQLMTNARLKPIVSDAEFLQGVAEWVERVAGGADTPAAAAAAKDAVKASRQLRKQGNGKR